MAAGYVLQHRKGHLSRRVQRAMEMLSCCSLCGHNCQVDRFADTGVCGAGPDMELASYGPHYGEEQVLVGRGGSGTVFFARCTLHCMFCQNHDISQGKGRRMTPAQLSDIMLLLQRRGCANINFVSPTHFLPQILQAVDLAAARGLELPLVYNSGGYDSLAGLKLLAGIVDIYMPDMKFADKATALELTGAPDYPAVNRRAVAEMYAQVGPLEVNRGQAAKGLLVRHLVLPGGLAGSEETLAWLANHCPGAGVNVMGQYYPCYRAHGHGVLSRRVSIEEVAGATAVARELGLSLV